MKLRHTLLWASIVFVCASCGEKSLAATGYQKYKDANTNYLLSIGGTGKEITYNSCSYAHITGDGIYAAENLKDSIYYLARWTMTLEAGSTSVIDYFVYYANEDRLASLKDSTAYDNACYLIQNGSLTGKMGGL